LPEKIHGECPFPAEKGYSPSPFPETAAFYVKHLFETAFKTDEALLFRSSDYEKLISVQSEARF